MGIPHPSRPHRVSPSTALAASLAVSLTSGATLKGRCFGAHTSSWRSRLCYSDIQPLYHDHGIARHVFPYVHARLASGVGTHGFNEYPVLTGLFMWAAGWLASSASSYLVVTIILLGLCAGLTAWLLWRMATVRTAFWTASPILVVYAFHNWDLLAVTGSVAGIYLWWSGSPRAAALAFAVGGAFKLYPALFVIPLVCDQLAQRRTRKAAEVGAIGVGSLALINLPFVVISASGWWATYRFHADRAPITSGTIWAVLDRGVSTATENRVSFTVLAAALALITLRLFFARPSIGYPVVEWCAAATAACIALNKVSSPQYILWLVPFLALLHMRAAWWWLLSAAALVRYAGLFGVDVLPLGIHTADRLVRIAVVVQAGLLVLYVARILLPSGNARARLLPRAAVPPTGAGAVEGPDAGSLVGAP